MKVKELIEALQKCDPEVEVFMNDSEYGPEDISDVHILGDGPYDYIPPYAKKGDVTIG